MKLQFLCFLIIFCLRAYGQNSANKKADEKNLSCFETKKINFTKLDTNQIKKILNYAYMKEANFICYQNTLKNSDTVRIAYKLKENNYWVSFPTPFKHPTLIYQFINIDNSGQLELVCEGAIIDEVWPRGQSVNDATIIFQINNIPTQIFKCCKACNVLNLGGKYVDDPIDFNIKREIVIKDGLLTIGTLELNKLNKKDKETYNRSCHLTDVTHGTYKLLNGKFIKQ